MKFEFSTFKTVTSCSLMMFANFNLSAQETFKINSETISKISLENSNIFPVEYKEIEYFPLTEGKVFTESYKNFLDGQKDTKEQYGNSKQEDEEFSDDEKYEIGKVKSTTLAKRNAYVMSEKSLNSWTELYGTYNEIAKVKSITDFEGSMEVFKEIIIDNKNYEETRTRFFDINRLVKNNDTGKIYYFPRRIISEINSQEDYLVVEKQLVSNGYKAYEQNGQKFINTKHYKVPITNILKQLIGKDKDYLRNIDLRFEKMQALRKQSLTFVPKMENYIRVYRLQRNKMSKADISAWTVVTKSAMNLNKQFVDLNDKMWGVDYEILDKNYLKFSNEFDDYLGASKGVLGL